MTFTKPAALRARQSLMGYMLSSILNAHDFAYASDVEPGVTVTGLEPNNAFLNDEEFEGHVRGTGFTEQTVIWWNGAAEPTRFVDDTDVWTLVRPSAVTSPTTVQVTVRTPSGYKPKSVPFVWAQGEGFVAVSDDEDDEDNEHSGAV